MKNIDVKTAPLEEAYEFNFKVLDRVFGWLLENNLVEDSDIDDNDSSPEGAAQTYINIYKRLLEK